MCQALGAPLDIYTDPLQDTHGKNRDLKIPPSKLPHKTNLTSCENLAEEPPHLTYFTHIKAIDYFSTEK